MSNIESTRLLPVEDRRGSFRSEAGPRLNDGCKEDPLTSPHTQQRNMIIKIHSPQHKFHSNHWYHMGEYFLSHHSDPLLHTTLTSSSISTKHTVRGEKEGISNEGVGGIDTLLIIAPDVRFIEKMTHMSLFVMLLGFPLGKVGKGGIQEGKIARIEIYEPTPLYRSQSEHPDIYSSNTGHNEELTFVSFLSHQPAIVYDFNQPPSQQFMKLGKYDDENAGRVSALAMLTSHLSLSTSSLSSGSRCKKGFLLDGGKIGETPIQSKEWFHSSVEVEALRSKTAWMCSGYSMTEGDESSMMMTIDRSYNNGHGHADSNGDGDGNQNGEKRYKLAIYERNHNRHFIHVNDVVKRLHTHLSDLWDITLILHSEKMHPCLLYSVLQGADMFLTTHGFQSTGVTFMKPGAVLFEVMPYKYFKPSYIHLSTQLQVRYSPSLFVYLSFMPAAAHTNLLSPSLPLSLSLSLSLSLFLSFSLSHSLSL
jgi:hypothetical protein